MKAWGVFFVFTLDVSIGGIINRSIETETTEMQDFEFIKRQIFNKEVIHANDGCKYRVLHTGSNWCVMHLRAEKDIDVFHGGISDCIEFIMEL